jgi:hypothetical protein
MIQRAVVAAAVVRFLVSSDSGPRVRRIDDCERSTLETPAGYQLVWDPPDLMHSAFAECPMSTIEATTTISAERLDEARVSTERATRLLAGAFRRSSQRVGPTR